MDEVTEKTKTESVRSFQSTIHKLEKALLTMDDKGANTGLIHKRLQAMKVGLAMLDQVWQNKATDYGEAAITEAREVFKGLLPSLAEQFLKASQGSPQATLLERRITAFNLAITAIESRIISSAGSWQPPK